MRLTLKGVLRCDGYHCEETAEVEVEISRTANIFEDKVLTDIEEVRLPEGWESLDRGTRFYCPRCREPKGTE